ncbi:MAG TPA: PHB depolymerase family esterase [Pseudonocardia sp.]|nr:PHB depolymerase family esterase [Pseudonocardia sp.]
MPRLAVLLLLAGLALAVALTRGSASASDTGPDSATAASAASDTGSDPGPGTAATPITLTATLHTLAFGGTNRTYRAYTPTGPAARRPLLVVLHGRGQSARAAISQTGFLPLVQRDQAVVIYPDGLDRSWNAGDGCCGVAATRRVPDAGFIEAVVADALSALPVDAGRVYLVGYSNGGKLGYSLACQRPALFTAIATYGSVPLAACPAGTAPVPVLLAAGVRDTILPFAGAPRAHPPLPSDRAALTWLRTQNRCVGAPVTATAGRATTQHWNDCAAGSDIESVVYPGVGHAWPTAATSGTPALPDLMWAFLSTHRSAPRLAELAATPTSPAAAPASPATDGHPTSAAPPARDHRDG